MERETRLQSSLHARLQTRTSYFVTLGGVGHATLAFDLATVDMTPEQDAIVRKLFSQNPVAVAADGEHVAAREAGQEGPASKHLTPAEFESIRKLGVRLGTQGVLSATACDFCLHCVKLEALPNAGAGLNT
ncbi:hypothetical protein [Caballeronia sp. LZ035]|uniref:hypothetical protein n=1 Tax=Caballeronia sp. LZ035 TaxID=3038568 RepID=UPI002856F5F0|nr:hypothetical protein [Caballeronia sp. LZ035]MDR5760485.1 hypothetical protein [Caballeronia sp. LZ035]